MKIQLKRSNVLEGGKAKEPTAQQMEYGELAVNYSNGDPAIFIKDSNNNIIRIAGAGSASSGDVPSGSTPPNTGNEVGDLFFDTTNNILVYWNGTEWVPITGEPDDGEGYVKVSGDNMTGNLTLGTNKITLNAANGSATFTGKATSASTASGDVATTLTTKDYVDSVAGGSAGSTDISITHAATTATVNSSTGTNGQINAATTSLAGVMTSTDKTKLDGITAGAQPNVGTNLSNTPSATNVAVNSSTGTNTTIPAATTSLAGVMTSSDKSKLDGIAAGAGQFVGTNLGNSATTTNVTVTSSTGTNTALPAATTSAAGVMTSADKSKLDGIAAGAQVNVGTNLSNTPSATNVAVNSSTGNNTTIPAASTSAAGVMTSNDKSKLDGIPTNIGYWSRTGTTLTPDNSGDDVSLNDIDVSGRYASGVTTVSALDIDCSSGNYFTKTISSNSTFTFSNVPASKSFSFTLELRHTSGTVTWPSSVKFPADSAPTLTTGKTHLFMFVTHDGGTRFRGTALVDYTN